MRLKGFVLMERNGKYLLIKEATAKWNGMWFLPGGSVKPGESLEEGTKREVLEEAGCDVELVSVFCVKYSAGFFNKKTSVFFFGNMVGERIKTLPDTESLEVRWLSYEELQGLPLRKSLKKLIDIYRDHTNFVSAEKFSLGENKLLNWENG